MAKGVLNTQTNLFRDGSQIEIFTFYTEDERSIEAFISSSQNIDGVQFLDGELGFKIINWGIDFKLNSLGELIVVGDDANKFEIDNDGNLTITE